MELSHCSAAMLKPYSTSYGAFLDQLNGSNAYDEDLDAWAEEVGEEVKSIARKLKISLSMEEVDLTRLDNHARWNGSQLLSRKRANSLKHTDMIVAINPTSEVLAYIVALVRREPFLRSIIAVSHVKDLDAMHDALATRVQLLPEKKSLPKMFAVAQDRPENHDMTIARALVFPAGQGIPQFHP